MLRRSVLLIAAATTALLGASEVVARRLASDLPPAVSYLSLEADKKVDRMEELEREGGAALAFVGSSMVYGVDPSLMPDAVGDRTSAYNASLGSSVPLISAPWALNTVIPRLDPDVVVLGISSFDLADEPGGVAIAEGFVQAPGFEDDAGRLSTIGQIDMWLAERSQLWASRQSLRDPEVVLNALAATATVDDRVAATIQPTGRPSLGQDQEFEDREHAGGGSLTSWAVGTRNIASIRQLIREARDRGVQVVIVDLPVTPEYVARHPNGQADFDTYLGVLRELAADEQVPLLEFHTIQDHRFFADEVHLNRRGVEHFTPLLVDALREAGALDGVLVDS